MLLRSKRVWYQEAFQPADIWIKQGTIAGVYPYGRGEQAAAAEQADMDAEAAVASVVDHGNLRIIPGLLDIHTHGAYGHDTNDGDAAGLCHWAERLPEEGVTAFLPTTVSAGGEELSGAVRSVKAAAVMPHGGAEILGIHLEGPWLSPDYRGAQPEEVLGPTSIAEFRKLQEEAGGLIRRVTLAPERDPGFQLIRYCKEQGVRVSLGHSGAGYQTAKAAAESGASSVTHVFNGMAPFHHRAPGLACAAMDLEELYAEIICDCRHVAPEVIRLLFKLKGPDRCMAVSDSLRCKKTEPGTVSFFAGREVRVDDKGLARFSCGTIAGSTLSMNQGLRNLIENCGVEVSSAIKACTVNPARYLGLIGKKGLVCAGYNADLVVLGEDYEVLQTYCKGWPSLLKKNGKSVKNLQ